MHKYGLVDRKLQPAGQQFKIGCNSNLRIRYVLIQIFILSI